MQFKGNPNIRFKWLIQLWNFFIFIICGPVCSLRLIWSSWGHRLGCKVNKERCVANSDLIQHPASRSSLCPFHPNTFSFLLANFWIFCSHWYPQYLHFFFLSPAPQVLTWERTSLLCSHRCSEPRQRVVPHGKNWKEQLFFFFFFSERAIDLGEGCPQRKMIPEPPGHYCGPLIDLRPLDLPFPSSPICIVLFLESRIRLNRTGL